MLQLHAVFKSYRQGRQTIDALRGVDLAIDEPGFFAVMGPSGSGKSTLLHLAAGLDRPDRGRVVVDGQDLSNMGDGQLTLFRRRRVGIVFQKFNLIPTLSAAQNVALPARLDHRPSSWIRQRVAELLESLGLTDRAEHRPDALSGGEQQRVAIARALVFSPKLLLADEPTGSLDSANSDRLWTLLGDLAKRHAMTVVMVTHEAAAASHCERIYVLGDGVFRGSFDVNGLDHASVATRYQQLGR
ncbi:MAG: ABC transporter ATP-binding protein [Planctomycetota bacterium]|nr:ABC transporter ATP-binding protein [Planctomycetota bacterium]